MMTLYVATGLGGALGSVVRLLVSQLFPAKICSIPSPILLINILGCFLMGLLTELLTTHWSPSTPVKYFLISGFLGGFTTFSAFSLDVGLLLQKNETLLAGLYVMLSICLSLFCYFVGVKLVKLF